MPTFRTNAHRVAKTVFAGALLWDLKHVPDDVREAKRFSREARLACESARAAHPRHALLLHGYGEDSPLARTQGRLDPDNHSGLFFMPATEDWISPLVAAGYAQGGHVALFRGPPSPLRRGNAPRAGQPFTDSMHLESPLEVGAREEAHYASNPAGSLYLLPRGIAQTRLEPLALTRAPQYGSWLVARLHSLAACSMSADPCEASLTAHPPAHAPSLQSLGPALSAPGRPVSGTGPAL